VFVLLERLFWEFDQLAQRMDVFKLSSVGDCYIAVTGVPDPRPDQAVVLAEFARATQRQSSQVFHELNATLDTGCLSMRFGLHTGPIVGGVLRGQRSRFELFGDSINMTSRMESTGRPGCIQVSADFAKVLQEDHGLASWVKPREGLVAVKGKGNLPTYWLTSSSDSDMPIEEKTCQAAEIIVSDNVHRHDFDCISSESTDTTELLDEDYDDEEMIISQR